MSARVRPLQARAEPFTAPVGPVLDGHGANALEPAIHPDEVTHDGVVHEPAPDDVAMVVPPSRGPEERAAFAQAVAELKIGIGSVAVSESRLFVAGAVLAPLGLVVVLLGWFGAARTPHLFEQVPYLISGGLFGLGLAFLGGFLYFAHWITELLRETRGQTAAVVAVLERLEANLAAPVAAAPGATAVPHPTPAPIPFGEVDHAPVPVGGLVSTGLVATARGGMAHRPDCVVVAGKDGVRPVGAHENLATCKLCAD